MSELRPSARVAGVDEVGRGALAGPVVAAAVVLNQQNMPGGLGESKTLTARKSEKLFHQLAESAVTAFAMVGPAEIDRLNVLGATLLAMKTAVERLDPSADFVLVDGPYLPQDLPCPGRAVVRGDGISCSIAAASIVAKVIRDRHMAQLARDCPGYGWERNAGYPTVPHRDALRRLGVTRHHRRSFRPVRKLLQHAST